jgi:hypothetical protein
MVFCERLIASGESTRRWLSHDEKKLALVRSNLRLQRQTLHIVDATVIKPWENSKWMHASSKQVKR